MLRDAMLCYVCDAMLCYVWMVEEVKGREKREKKEQRIEQHEISK